MAATYAGRGRARRTQTTLKPVNRAVSDFAIRYEIIYSFELAESRHGRSASRVSALTLAMSVFSPWGIAPRRKEPREGETRSHVGSGSRFFVLEGEER